MCYLVLIDSELVVYEHLVSLPNLWVIASAWIDLTRILFYRHGISLPFLFVSAQTEVFSILILQQLLFPSPDVSPLCLSCPDVCMFTIVLVAGCVCLVFKKEANNALQAFA